MARQLKAEKFDYIYDAHSNIRSNILKAVLLPPLYHLFPRGPRYTLAPQGPLETIFAF